MESRPLQMLTRLDNSRSNHFGLGAAEEVACDMEPGDNADNDSSLTNSERLELQDDVYTTFMDIEDPHKLFEALDHKNVVNPIMRNEFHQLNIKLEKAEFIFHEILYCGTYKDMRIVADVLVETGLPSNIELADKFPVRSKISKSVTSISENVKCVVPKTIADGDCGIFREIGYYDFKDRRNAPHGHGLCVIVANSWCRSIEFDIRTIKQFFIGRLQFEVIQCTTTSSGELHKTLTNIVEKLNHQSSAAYDRLVVFILCHGDADSALNTGDTPKVSRYKTEEIIANFSDDKIPLLIGNPKLFLFQAYTGTIDEDEKNSGESVPSSTSATNLFETAFSLKGEPDKLVCLASTAGDTARMDGGSMFIQIFIEVLTEYHATETVEDMMTVVNRRIWEMAHKHTNGQEKQHKTEVQLPWVLSCLTKRFYLHLKLKA